MPSSQWTDKKQAAALDHLVMELPFSVMAIMVLQAALIFRRFFGEEPSFLLKLCISVAVPAPAANASKAAFGSAAMRANSSAVSFLGFVMWNL